MRYIRKGLYYFLITAILIISGSGIAAVIYKNEIINLLKDEVDRNIKSELKVDNIDLKLFRGFPNISIEFQGVEFHSNFEDEILLASKSVYFELSILSLFKENIVIETLEIHDAEIIVHVNEFGKRNFDVFTTQLGAINSNDNNLNLNTIVFKDVQILFIDDLKVSRDSYYLDHLKGSLSLDNTNLKLDVVSELRLIETNMRHLKWILNKKVAIKTKSKVVDNLIEITSSEISIEKAKFNLKGVLDFQNDRYMDLNLSSSDLKFLELVSILPNYVQEKLTLFKGNGTISIYSNIKGKITKHKWPSFEAKYDLHDFEIHHADLLHPMKRITLIGEIKIDNLQKMSTGSVTIDKMNLLVETHEIMINGSLTNFDLPQIKGDIEGTVEMSWGLALLGTKLKSIGNTKGLLGIDCSVNFKLDKQFGVIENNLDGKIVFDSVSVSNIYGLPLYNMNGVTQLNGDRIVFDNLSATYGRSDVNVNGFLKLVTKLNVEKRINANLEIKSRYLDLNQILNIFIPVKDSEVDSNSQTPKFNVKLNLSFDELRFMKFVGKRTKADLSITENLINVNKVTTHGMGGKITLTGNILKQYNGDNYIKAKTQTRDIDLDSLFFVFDNFNQKFITRDAIKGKLNSNVYTYMYFNSDWEFKRELLYAEAALTIKEGELNNFEPVMSLSSYLNEENENLADLRFSDIENQILISNDTIYIAEMNVGTNIRNIRIGGYHTFNQQIDYRLAVPVVKNRRDKDEKFGQVKTDKSGQLYFPFRIKGTTSDYKVTYDFKTASSNFITGVKREIKGLGSTLIGNAEENIEKDSTALEEEEFFEWEDN